MKVQNNLLNFHDAMLPRTRRDKIISVCHLVCPCNRLFPSAEMHQKEERQEINHSRSSQKSVQHKPIETRVTLSWCYLPSMHFTSPYLCELIR